MLKLLFKTTAYYVIWQKFKKQIITILISLILIGLVDILYEDLYRVFRINNKNDIGVLLLFKWFLIFTIVGINIYILRKTNINNDEINQQDTKEKNINKSKKEVKTLNKKVLLSTTDLILKKYTKNEN